MCRALCVWFLAFWVTLPLTAGETIQITPELADVLTQRYPRGPEDLRLLEQQVQKVATQAIAATVEVEVNQGIGSGVIVSREGLVLTAAHVIGKPNRPATLILADGHKLKGRTLGAHHTIDAAMVQIENPPQDLPFAPLVTDKAFEVGQWVVATGQPGGILDNRAPPVRLGRILTSGGKWICTDCALVGGDSGGPLFNLRGQVFAIHMSIGPQAVHNFHVPIEEVRPYWDKMLAGETWGHEFDPAEDDADITVLGIASRVVANQCLITQVFPGFPAEQMGVKPGDIVISVDTQPVDSLADLAAAIAAKDAGEAVHLEVLRNRQSIALDIELVTLDEPLPGSFDPADESPEESP